MSPAPGNPLPSSFDSPRAPATLLYSGAARRRAVQVGGENGVVTTRTRRREDERRQAPTVVEVPVGVQPRNRNRSDGAARTAASGEREFPRSEPDPARRHRRPSLRRHYLANPDIRAASPRADDGRRFSMDPPTTPDGAAATSCRAIAADCGSDPHCGQFRLAPPYVRPPRLGPPLRTRTRTSPASLVSDRNRHPSRRRRYESRFICLVVVPEGRPPLRARAPWRR